MRDVESLKGFCQKNPREASSEPEGRLCGQPEETTDEWSGSSPFFPSQLLSCNAF